MAAELEGRLPDMFRLRPQDVQVTVLPRQYVYCSLRSAVSTTFMVLETVAQLAAADDLGNVVRVRDVVSPYDHIVAAMPINSLGSGIDGANHPLAPRYVLVDTGKPSAVIHELGHAIGLYRSPEQYDQFPPDGLPLEGVTAFATADWVPLPGDKRRIAHFPRKDDWWARPPDYHDVMGATDLNWPVPEYCEQLQQLLRRVKGRRNRRKARRCLRRTVFLHEWHPAGRPGPARLLRAGPAVDPADGRERTCGPERGQGALRGPAHHLVPARAYRQDGRDVLLLSFQRLCRRNRRTVRGRVRRLVSGLRRPQQGGALAVASPGYRPESSTSACLPTA